MMSFFFTKGSSFKVFGILPGILLLSFDKDYLVPTPKSFALFLLPADC